MLHLTNGEATATLLRLAEVQGEVRSVDDVLMEGPLRNALATPADLTHRAAWLEKRLGIPKGDYLAHHGRRSKTAREAAGRDVVLWSEEDLFCQVNLAELITRLDDARLFLVTPTGDDERLGERSVHDVAALLAARREVAPARREAARRFWRAIAGPDPRALDPLAREGEPAWPQLQRAATLHLQRFPWTTDGLDLVQRTFVRALEREPAPFARLFDLTTKEPLRGYGMGDTQALATLRGLASGERPLVWCDDPRGLDDVKATGAWGLTPLGQEVAQGATDAVEARGIDAWRGGVHLEGPQARWRYDPDARGLRESLSSPTG